MDVVHVFVHKESVINQLCVNTFPRSYRLAFGHTNFPLLKFNMLKNPSLALFVGACVGKLGKARQMKGQRFVWTICDPERRLTFSAPLAVG